MADWIGYRSVARHSKSRQRERTGEQYRRLQASQFVQGQEPRGVDE